MKNITKAKKLVSICLAAGLCLSSSACTLFEGGDGSQDSKIKNVILIIGDGMGLNHIEAGELALGKPLEFTSWDKVKVNTSSVTDSGSLTTTDSAASATALATGTLTKNGYVGKDPDQNDLRTIMDVAKEYGKATGVVSTDAITGATPGGFSGHSINRDDSGTIFVSQTTSGVDLMCATPNTYSDIYGYKLEENGYTVYDNFADIAGSMTKDKAWWQFSMSGVEAEVQLEDVATHALNFLDRDEDGFVLMMEQAYVDKYSHNNEIDGMLKSVHSLNNTVKKVLEWIGDRKDTAVLITADHETGGLEVSGTAGDYPNLFITPEGNMVSYQWTTTSHTNSFVGLFTYGFTPDFSNTYYQSNKNIKNIDIYKFMESLVKQA